MLQIDEKAFQCFWPVADGAKAWIEFLAGARHYRRRPNECGHPRENKETPNTVERTNSIHFGQNKETEQQKKKTKGHSNKTHTHTLRQERGGVP